MASNLKIEDVFIQIRGKLQLDGVKLWLLPYYDESVGVCDEEIMVKRNNEADMMTLNF